MFSKLIISSILLAALANGLVFKRDDGDNNSTPPALSLPSISPEPIRLPDPTISLSLPPLDQNLASTPIPTLLSSPSLPSVVTTTVYVYPSKCLPTRTPPPTPSPSRGPDSVHTPLKDDPLTLPSGGPSSLRLPDVQGTPLYLPPVRRDGSVVSQLRLLQQQVVNTWVDLGKGNSMLPVVGQLESLIAQAATPGANGPALLKQAQSLVNNS